MSERAREAIAAKRPFRLGEVEVAFQEGHIGLSGPRPQARPVTLDATIEALRTHVRFDERGRYRPLSGARTLPGGWRTALPTALAEAALEAIYPQAALHQEQAARGTLRTVTFDEVVARQRGRYRLAGALDAAGREHAREAVCGRCVRTPVWAGKTATGAAIPCPEPCSVLLALCREAALWQQDAPAPARPNPTVAFADFTEAGNELREAYLAHAPAVTPRG